MRFVFVAVRRLVLFQVVGVALHTVDKWFVFK